MQAFPAATDGDVTIFESNAILVYAAENDKSYPKDLKTRARINSWLLWEACAWFPSCYSHVVENVVKPNLLSEKPDQATLDAEAPKWAKLAGILDQQLGKSKFLVGDSVTIADIAVASPMHIWRISGLSLDPYPNLKRWYNQDIKNLDCWKNTQAPVTKVFGENVGMSSRVPCSREIGTDNCYRLRSLSAVLVASASSVPIGSLRTISVLNQSIISSENRMYCF